LLQISPLATNTTSEANVFESPKLTTAFPNKMLKHPKSHSLPHSWLIATDQQRGQIYVVLANVEDVLVSSKQVRSQ
jgi:hypothetical protein